MAALTAVKLLETNDGSTWTFPLTNGDTAYNGSLMGFDASSAGRVRPYTAGDAFAGIYWTDADSSTTGVDGASTVAATPKIGLTQEQIIIEATVTGAGATSVGELVYPTNDNPDDLTITKPSGTDAIGYIVDHLTGTSCKVLIFSVGACVALSAASTTVVPTGGVAYTGQSSAAIANDLASPIRGNVQAVNVINEASLVSQGAVRFQLLREASVIGEGVVPSTAGTGDVTRLTSFANATVDLGQSISLKVLSANGSVVSRFTTFIELAAKYGA